MRHDRSASGGGAAEWPPLRALLDAEASFADSMGRRRSTAFLYEFVRFGLKQAWACLFGGAMVALLIGTHFFYPAGAPLARYDFLFLSALAIQALMLSFGLETFEEAKVILAYHVVGTAMEVFKTSVGSWIYPEPSFFRIVGVPLFTGFMYSCIGSYLCRIWGLLHFRFDHHPSIVALVALSVAIYVNFFSHHYVPDVRYLLFAVAVALFFRTRIYFTVWREPRSMPLLLGLVLVTAFIWLAENVGTYTRTWLYPAQQHGWAPVGFGKFGSWFLLLIISYSLVALIKKADGARELSAGPSGP